LVNLSDFREGAPLCARCGEVLRVVPSPTYVIGDLELFEELSDTVADSVSPMDAGHWATLVERALQSGTFGKILDALVVRWPGLVPLRTVVGANRAQQQRVLRMFKTIFEALSLTRHSETLSVVPAAKLDDPPPRVVRHRARSLRGG